MIPYDFNFLLSLEVQSFINSVYKDFNSIESYLLRKPPHHWSVEQYQSVLFQIDAQKKIGKKLPFLLEKQGIIFPPKLHLEQASSELSASWKCQEIKNQYPDKQQLIDGTGGFGIDSYFFSKHFESVFFIEPNATLLEIAKHNFQVLGIDNVSFHCQTIEDFLISNKNTFSNETILYLDPSRRDEDKNRVYDLNACTPVIQDIIRSLQEANTFLPLVVKASPVISIMNLETDYHNLRKVQCLDINNDAKELLLYFNVEKFNGATNVLYEAHSIQKGEHQRCAEENSFKEAEDFYTAELIEGKYLFEPYASVMKLGLFKAFANKSQSKKIAPKTNFFFSDSAPKEPIQAKIYQLQKPIAFSKKAIQQTVGKKANIVMRNSAYSSVAEFCKKMGIQDGGDKTLIIFKNYKGLQECWLVERIFS